MTHRPSHSLLPSLSLLLFVLALMWALTAPFLSGDLGWQIRAGQQLLDSGDVPRLNFLVFTSPLHSWVAQEWLTGTLLAAVDRWAGLGGLVMLRVALFGGLLVSVYRLCRWLGAEPMALALLMVPIGAQLALHTALRPWLISDIAIVGLLWLCLSINTNRARLLWIVVPYFGIWALFHGGWVWGAVICVCFGGQWWFDRSGKSPSRRQILGVALAGCVVLSLGPYGLETLVFPLRYLLRDPSSGIETMYAQVKEWAPPDMTSLFGLLLLFQAGLAVVGLYRMSPRSPALAVLCAAFFYMAIGVQRHIPIFVLATLPPIVLGLLAPLATRVREGAVPRVRRLSWEEGRPRTALFAVVSVVVFLGGSAWVSDPEVGVSQLEDRGYPVEAAQALKTLPPGRLLNHYDWGGFLPWMAPGWEVFITPVPDAYPSLVFDDWLTMANMKPGWEGLLKRWRVDAALFPPQSALIQALSQTEGWTVVHRSDLGVLVLREGYVASTAAD